jgi:hypothetical protein
VNDVAFPQGCPDLIVTSSKGEWFERREYEVEDRKRERAVQIRSGR